MRVCPRQSETEVTITLQEVEELAGLWQRPAHRIEAKVTGSSCELQGRRGEVRARLGRVVRISRISRPPV